MKAILTDKGVLVPYKMIVRLKKYDDGTFSLHDRLGEIHGCSNEEGLKFINWLHD